MLQGGACSRKKYDQQIQLLMLKIEIADSLGLPFGSGEHGLVFCPIGLRVAVSEYYK